VSEDRLLGVDLEAEPRIAPELTAPLAFTERELAHLHGLPPEDQRETFLRCWTRKEAVVKGRRPRDPDGLDRRGHPGHSRGVPGPDRPGLD